MSQASYDRMFVTAKPSRIGSRKKGVRGVRRTPHAHPFSIVSP